MSGDRGHRRHPAHRRPEVGGGDTQQVAGKSRWAPQPPMVGQPGQDGQPKVVFDPVAAHVPGQPQPGGERSHPVRRQDHQAPQKAIPKVAVNQSGVDGRADRQRNDDSHAADHRRPEERWHQPTSPGTDQAPHQGPAVTDAGEVHQPAIRCGGRALDVPHPGPPLHGLALTGSPHSSELVERRRPTIARRSRSGRAARSTCVGARRPRRSG